jgi:glycosyltransferase involved in cell wall biosynthesis
MTTTRAPTHPYLSIVVPVHQGARVLPWSLEALAASDLPRECWELIVVDDASTDTTSLIAAQFADIVVRLPGKPRGPAYARNRGFEVARGECIVFVDADVCVHSGTLRQFARVFATEADVSAVFGSYDSKPPAKGLVSQYRNLLHHYTHHRNPGEAQTFWAGCGAVRAGVFREAGMYDEWHFTRPQIEDIELGHRIRALGHRIVLRPEIQGSHLKQWTLRGMVLTDLNDRGVPWTRLLVQEGQALAGGSLNIKNVEKVNTLLTCMAVVFVFAAIWTGRSQLLFGTIDCLLWVLFVNRSLYTFFESARGFFFALAVVPLHLLYYVLNGMAAFFGWMLHETVGEPIPDATTQAFAEVGVKSWPPVRVKHPSGAWRLPKPRE